MLDEKKAIAIYCAKLINDTDFVYIELFLYVHGALLSFLRLPCPPLRAVIKYEARKGVKICRITV